MKLETFKKAQILNAERCKLLDEIHQENIDIRRWKGVLKESKNRITELKKRLVKANFDFESL